MRQVVAWLRLATELSTARLPALGVVLVGSALVFMEPASRSSWLGHAHDTGMYLSVLSFAIAGSFFAVAGYLTALGRLAQPDLRFTEPRAQLDGYVELPLPPCASGTATSPD